MIAFLMQIIQNSTRQQFFCCPAKDAITLIYVGTCKCVQKHLHMGHISTHSPQSYLVDILKPKMVEGSYCNDENDKIVVGNSSEVSWQLELTKTFFSLRTKCEIDEKKWAAIIEPSIFLFCMPRTPYRAQAASATICKRTQLHAIMGLLELVEDMHQASDKSRGSVSVVFSVIENEFYANHNRAFAKLKLYVHEKEQLSVFAAAKMTFDSTSRKLTRVETCFDGE